MTDFWVTAENRLWEIGEEPVLRNDIALIGVSISADGFAATLGGMLPCETLTEFQNGNTWVVTRGGDEFKEEDIVLQLNGCELIDMHLGAMTTMRMGDNSAVSVAVNVACERVWIK
jgi:hypothetical protein